MMGRVNVPSSSRLLKSVLCLAAFGLSATGAWGASCVVSTTADSGAGSLRACLSALSTGTAVDTNGITFTATGTITLGSALPAIANGVTITGPGANQLTIDGAGAYQIMVVNGSGITVSISGLTFANGKTGTNGGAISLTSGALTVSGSTFTGNSAGASGGAISNSGGTLTVTGSTFTLNSATVYGGAIDGTAGVTATNDTFYGNTSGLGTNGGGGALEAFATATVTNSTFYGNSSKAGGAVDVTSTGSLTANNNIFAGNSASIGGAGIFNGNGGTANADHNVYYNNLTGASEDDCSSCSSNTSASTASSNPLMLSLGNYGGATQTYLPQPGSAAICAGSATSATAAGVTADQRGFAVVSACVDAGAVQTNYITVTNTGESNSAACPNSSKCTLREAVATAAGQGDIDFGVTSVTLSGSGLTLSLPTTGSAGVNIVGSATSPVKVDGGAAGTVFTVSANVPAVLYGLTITNGKVTGSGAGINNSGSLALSYSSVTGSTATGSGGGIYNGGKLAILASTVSGNATTGGDGGGIVNATGATMTVLDSTISTNTTSSGSGGGIYNSGTSTITESTVSGNTANNTATAFGGGIVSGGTLTVINSTVSGNKVAAGGGSDQGGGIYVGGGTTSLANTIVSGNTSDGTNPDVASGSYTDNSGNVIGGTVNLAALGLYGPNAVLQTQIPLPGGANGNPAICAGKSANVPSSVIADERGGTISPNDCPAGFVDAGAVQTDYTSIAFTATPSGTNTVGTALSPAPAVTLNESGQALAVSGVSIPITMTGGTLYGTGVTSGTATAATDGTGVATFSGLDATAGSGLNLAATLQLNATLKLTATTSTSFSIGKASTTVAVVGSGNPTSPVVSNSLTFVGTVSPQNPAVPLNLDTTGTITFTDSLGSTINCNSEPVTITAGVATATCTTTGLAAGTNHKIYAVYNGDSNYAGSASGSGTPATISVGKAATAVVVTEGAGFPSNPTYGSSLTFNATVTPLDTGVPFSTSGTVTFTDTVNSTKTTLCTASVGAGTFTVSTGVATCTTTTLGLGTHSISAAYNANTDPNYLTTVSGAETALTGLAITQATPTVTLTCSSSPSSGANCAQTITQGATETFTSVVSGLSGLSAPTGSVEFEDNGSPITACGGTTGVALSTHAGNQQAVCQVTLGGGTHGILAIYLPDTSSSYVSAQASLSVTVGSGSTVTAFTMPATSTVNATVNFSGTVTASSPSSNNPDPQGTVTMYNGSTAITGCQNLSVTGVGQGTSQSTFSCQSNALPLGTDTIQAKFTSTDTKSYSSSNSQNQTITISAGTATITTVASSSNPSIVNNPVTFTATVVAPSGPTQPAGNVEFTAVPTGGGTTTTLCSQSKLGLSSPQSTTGTASCGPISSLAANSYTITATYTDTNGNFTSSPNSSLTQTVNPSGTVVSISAAPSSSTVNSPVNYSVTVTAASTAFPLSGVVQIKDENGNVICSGLTLTQASGSPTGTNNTCTQSNLTAGVHTITAIYNAAGSVPFDPNNGTGSGSTPVPVAPAGTSVVVSSSLNPSIVNNPGNVKDSVTFVATVTPTSTGTVSVPLSGTVTFTENGQAIPECPTPRPVATPTCTTTSLPPGQDTILAVYNNDNNYTGSTGYLAANGQVLPQTVQDFSLVISSTPPVVVSQGYTTSTDLFTPQTISVVPLSIQGFATATTPTAAPLNLACTVSTVFSAASTPTLPLCTPAAATLAVNGSGPQGAVSIVVDATNASAGIYTVTETGTDPTTQLAHSASFQVTVASATAPITVVSGATTGNSGNLTFMLPGGVTLSNLLCKSVSGPNLTSSVSPASLGITCAFNPTSVTNSSANLAAVQVTATVGTSGTTTTAAVSHRTNLWLAGLLGLPFFGLVGLIRGRKSRDSVFFRLVVIAVICVVAFQAVGCGGSFSTQPSNTSGAGGKTPPGVYKILVVGTGSDGQTYQAVLQLNVQL